MKIRNTTIGTITLCCALLAIWQAFPASGQEVTIKQNSLIGRVGETQIEILCPDSTRLLIDITAPEYLTQPVTDKDILLTTHLHNDHFNKEFSDTFLGKQLRMERGAIILPSVRIKSIPGSHSNKWPTEQSADNFILIIDAGALRIVHLADIEQKSLMPEQLVELENIDVIIASLYYPNIIGIVDQLRPKIVIPTHMWGSPIMKSLIRQWPAYRINNIDLRLRKETLPSETTLFLIGDWGDRIGNMYKVPEWTEN